MKLTDRISYIQGFADGLNLDQNKDEVKVINMMLDLLTDMAEEVVELQECYDESVDIIDAINEDLSEVESAIFDYDDEDDCHHSDCCDCHDDCDCDEENPMYEVTCPQCDKKIAVTEDELFYGEIQCPDCDAVLEFDFSDLEDDCCDDECSCGCHHNEHLGEDDLMS